MDNEDLAALAAEYVLGTLSPDERAHAEALIAADPGFVDIVRQWERRLGELNVMVEAVEPPAEIWGRIKSGIGTPAAGDEVGLVPTKTAPPGPVEAESESKDEADAQGDPSAPFASLAASLSPAQSGDGTEAKPDTKAEARDTKPLTAAPRPTAAAPTAPQTERGAEVISLGRRVRRWRLATLTAGALAAALAALIVISQVDPTLIPAGGFHIPQLVAQQTPAPKPPAPLPPPGRRLVAVLQQDPSSPAFLLTIDPASKMLIVRRIASKAQEGHDFELWAIAPHAAPRGLGVVGEQEFTQAALPADLAADAMQAATYAVSFEPAGGSKTGAPTGPILFTGKLVESVPPPAPPAPKT
jgi:anti-sigma-K factor RskA